MRKKAEFSIVFSILILTAMISLLMFCRINAGLAPTLKDNTGGLNAPIPKKAAWVDLDNDGIADTLDQEIASRIANGTAQDYANVTVMLKSAPTAYDAAIFASCGGYLTTPLWTEAICGFGGIMPYSRIINFTKHLRDVLLVEREAIGHNTLAYAGQQVGDRPYVWSTVGLEGDPNSSIAIVDTGIDASHTDFSPGFGDKNFSEKIVGWYDNVTGSATPFDDNGHGSDVSGLAAGDGFFSTDGSGNAVATWGANLESVSSTGTYLISGMMINKTGTITIKVKWASTGTATLSALPLYYGGKNLSTGSWTQVASVSTPSQNGWYTLTYNVASTPSGGYDMYHVLMSLTAGTGNLSAAFTLSWPYAPPSDGFSTWTGIAPHTKLVGVKVLDYSGSGTSNSLISGINWIISNRIAYHITVASMSLAFDSEDAVVDSAIVNLVNSGVTTVVAAGNSGLGSNYIYTPGSVDEVITVAAMNQFDDTASYSSQGGTSRYTGQTVKPDITAPGGSFYAAPLFSADSNYNDAEGWWPDVQANDSAPMQGTSMAAPIVAGAANIIIQAMGGYTKWNWTRSQALLPKMILLMTATETYPNLRENSNQSTSPTLDRGGKDAQEGYGRLNLDASADAVLRAPYTIGTKVTGALGTPPNPGNISVLGQKLAWARNVQLISGLKYNFTLTVPSGADYDLYLYNGTGTTYGEPSIVTKSTNATIGGTEQFWITAPYTGTYYIVVKTATEATGNGTFTLTSSGPVYVTFSQTGVSPDFTGTVLTLDGTNYSVNNLPVSLWYDNGSSHTFAYQSPLLVTANQKQYVWNSTSGLSSSQNGTIIAFANSSVTGNYKTQYYVTFGQAGVGSDFTGTIVTIDGANHTLSDLPISFWYDNGSSHSFAYQSPLVATASRKQYVWLSTGGLSTQQSGSITVSSYGSMISIYKTQFWIQINSSHDTPTASQWVDSGSDFTASVTSPTEIVAGTLQWVCTGFNTDGGPLVPGTNYTFTNTSTNHTIIFDWKEQFWTVFSQFGVDSDFAGTAITIDAANYNISVLPASFWYDNGSTHTFAYQSPLIAEANHKQYVWTTTSGLSSSQSSSITVSGNGTVTGSYKTQWWIDITSGHDAPTASAWVDNTASFAASVTSPTEIVAGDHQWVCTGYSVNGGASIAGTNFTLDSVQAAQTIVFNWKEQFWIQVDSTHDTPTVSQWVDQSGNFTASVNSPADILLNNHQFVCTGFSIDGASSIPGIDYTFTSIQAAHNIVFNWKEQFWIQVNSLHDSPTASQWADQGSGLSVSVTSPADDDGMGTRYRCTGYALDSNLPITDGSTSYVLSNVQSSHAITFNWVTQYKLTVASVYDSPNPFGTAWFDSGTLITASVMSPVDQIGETRHRCTGWTGTGSVPASGIGTSVSLAMIQPSNVTWNWIVQYFVTFAQTGVGADFMGTIVTIDGLNYSVSVLPASFWYDSGSSHSFAYDYSLTITADQERYGWSSTTGLSILQVGTIAISGPGTVTGNYLTQFYVIFNQTGVGSDFTGSVVTIDGANYSLAGPNILPASFWWSNGSSHADSFFSPLAVNASEQFKWTSTTGMTTFQNGALTVTAPGTVTGNYQPVHVSLQMRPINRICREYGETFTVQVNVTDGFNIMGFSFNIQYNPTLLTVVSLSWNAWGTGTYNVDTANGNLSGYTSGIPITGNFTLITITFNATCYHLWKAIPGWTNDLSGTILIQWAKLTYPGSSDLLYLKGGTQNQINVEADVTYTFSPIQGDINNDGAVDVFDLRTEAAHFDQQYPNHDLIGHSTIDIFDLVLIGANFGYTYNN